MWRKDTLIIAILTFLTVAMWIFFDAYHTYLTSTIPTELKETIEEFDPKLDTQVIEDLKKRPTGFEAPIVTPTPEEATGSAEVEKEKEATESGITATPTVTISPSPTITATPTPTAVE